MGAWTEGLNWDEVQGLKRVFDRWCIAEATYRQAETGDMELLYRRRGSCSACGASTVGGPEWLPPVCPGCVDLKEMHTAAEKRNARELDTVSPKVALAAMYDVGRKFGGRL